MLKLAVLFMCSGLAFAQFTPPPASSVSLPVSVANGGTGSATGLTANATWKCPGNSGGLGLAYVCTPTLFDGTAIPSSVLAAPVQGQQMEFIPDVDNAGNFTIQIDGVNNSSVRTTQSSTFPTASSVRQLKPYIVSWGTLSRWYIQVPNLPSSPNGTITFGGTPFAVTGDVASLPAFPIPTSGVTSGGVIYASDTTHIAVSSDYLSWLNTPKSLAVGAGFVLDNTYPILANTAESSVAMDITTPTQCNMWYRVAPTTNFLQFATATDSYCSNWTPYGGNPVLSGIAYPYVITNGSLFYLFAIKASDGNLYFWTSLDGITWTIGNSGTAILTKAGFTWDNSLANPAVSFNGTTVYLIVEGFTAGSVGSIGYSTTTTGTWNFNTSLSATAILATNTGSPELKYVAARNSLLGIYHNKVDGYDVVDASYCSLAGDCGASANWHTAPGWQRVYIRGIQMTDPYLAVLSGKSESLLFQYGNNQLDIDQSYSSLSLTELYDSVISTSWPQIGAVSISGLMSAGGIQIHGNTLVTEPTNNSITSAVFAHNSVAALPPITFRGDLSTGFGHPFNSEIDVYIAGVARHFFKSNETGILNTSAILNFNNDTYAWRSAAGEWSFGTANNNTLGSWKGANGTLSGASSAATFLTATNCSNAASPAVCGSASAGAVAIPTGVTTVALTINTTAVTANSEIRIQADDTVTIAATTCNNTLATLSGGFAITGRVPGTSFTVTYNGTIATNPLCITYDIKN